MALREIGRRRQTANPFPHVAPSRSDRPLPIDGPKTRRPMRQSGRSGGLTDGGGTATCRVH